MGTSTCCGGVRIRICCAALLSIYGVGVALDAAEISLTVRSPDQVDRVAWPVTSGIPVAAGRLRPGEPVILRTVEGVAVPLQTEVLGFWPDGSIKWLLLDFQTDLQGGQVRTFVLQHGVGVAAPPQIESTVSLRHDHQGITIDTGVLKTMLNPARFRLLDRVWLDRDRDGRFGEQERMTGSEGAGIVLTTPDGQRFTADWTGAEMKIEQAGPLRACVRISGDHISRKGKRFRYVVRLHAYAGLPHLQLEYTFVNDFTDQTMTQVQGLDLVFAAPAAVVATGTLGGEIEGRSLFQVDDRRFEVDGQPAGRRAAGWAALACDRGGFAVGVRDFWQNWPKALTLEEAGKTSRLRIGILPDFPAGLYDTEDLKQECKLYYYLRNGVYTFKVGVARTHTLWATFFRGTLQRAALNQYFQAVDQPLLAQRTPEDVSQTRVLGAVPPADPNRYAGFDAWMNGFTQLHLEDVEVVREFGLLNYGDWFNVDWDSWGNLEYDTAHCFFMHYLRTGNRQCFARAAAGARHLVDVDIAHAVNEEVRGYGGSLNFLPGSIWCHTVGHTGGYYATYDGEKYQNEAPLVMKGAYQVGMSDTGHVWIEGVFDHYHLTGNRRSLEIALRACDVLASRMPTRYTDHLRGIGWPLNMMMAAHQATGQQKYLAAAKRNWEVLRKELDPERGWVVLLAYGHCNEASVAKRCRGQNTYMLALTLSALSRYHQVTRDPEVLAALSAGIDQMIRQCWSEEHQGFWLTSCDHLKHNPPPRVNSATMLSAAAFAHEYRETRNEEHRRIWLRSFQRCVEASLEQLRTKEQQGATGYSSMQMHFSPHGLPLFDGPPGADAGTGQRR